jgi:hypothetical protein
VEGIPFLRGRFPEYDGGKNTVVYHFDQTVHHVLPPETRLFSPLSGTVRHSRRESGVRILRIDKQSYYSLKTI